VSDGLVLDLGHSHARAVAVIGGRVPSHLERLNDQSAADVEKHHPPRFLRYFFFFTFCAHYFIRLKVYFYFLMRNSF